MVKLESKNPDFKTDQLRLIDSTYNACINLLEETDKELNKLLGDINTDVDYFGQNKIMLHGSLLNYFNSKVHIYKSVEMGRQNISNFSLSCFPNCCGIAILTSNYYEYAMPFKSDSFHSTEFTFKLVKTLLDILHYQSVILTITDGSGSYFTNMSKLLEQEGAKTVNTCTRKGCGGKLYTYVINKENFINKEELFKYLKKYEKNIVQKTISNIHERINNKVKQPVK